MPQEEQNVQPTNTTSRLLISIAAISFGVGLVTMTAISLYYEGRADEVNRIHREEMLEVRKAHRHESSIQEGRHTRDKTRLQVEIRDQLVTIERLVRDGGRR